jgi:hypothetical protein
MAIKSAVVFLKFIAVFLAKNIHDPVSDFRCDARGSSTVTPLGFASSSKPLGKQRLIPDSPLKERIYSLLAHTKRSSPCQLAAVIGEPKAPRSLFCRLLGL